MHTYYKDLHFLGGDNVPDCQMQIDHSHDTGVFLNLVASGTIHFRIKGQKKQIIEAPAAFWTTPGTIFRLGNLENASWHCLWVAASGPRIDKMLTSGLIPISSTPFCKISSRSPFTEKMSELTQLAIYDRDSDHFEMAQLWEQLFNIIHIEQEKSQAKRIPHMQIIQEFAWKIRDEPLELWDFKNEASNIGLSYPHYRRRFSQIIGTSSPRVSTALPDEESSGDAAVFQTTNRRRSRNHSLRNAFYFSRLFKSKMGMSPKKYQDNLRLSQSKQRSH